MTMLDPIGRDQALEDNFRGGYRMDYRLGKMVPADQVCSDLPTFHDTLQAAAALEVVRRLGREIKNEPGYGDVLKEGLLKTGPIGAALADVMALAGRMR